MNQLEKNGPWSSFEPKNALSLKPSGVACLLVRLSQTNSNIIHNPRMAPRISVSLCQKVKNEVRMTPLKPHESAHNILLFMKESSLNTPLFLTDRIKGINVTDNL